MGQSGDGLNNFEYEARIAKREALMICQWLEKISASLFKDAGLQALALMTWLYSTIGRGYAHTNRLVDSFDAPNHQPFRCFQGYVHVHPRSHLYDIRLISLYVLAHTFLFVASLVGWFAPLCKDWQQSGASATDAEGSTNITSPALPCALNRLLPQSSPSSHLPLDKEL